MASLLAHSLTARTDGPRRLIETALLCWEQAFRNERLTPDEKRRLILDGRARIREALAVDAGNVDALVCEILLIRLEGQLTGSDAERAALSEEIERLRARVTAASFTAGKNDSRA